jgi:hypothetical protein
LSAENAENAERRGGEKRERESKRENRAFSSSLALLSAFSAQVSVALRSTFH